MTRRRPRWDNEAAVAARVADEIAEAEALVHQYAWIAGAFVPDHVRPVEHLMLARMFREIADAEPSVASAIARAKRGDLKPLIELVHDNKLTPEAKDLVAEFLDGKRNLRTGGPRGKAGRPRMSETARRARNPVHDAFDDFEVIKAILARLYPKQGAKDIKDRAEKIAQDRAKVVTSIAKLRSRSRKSGHRIA